MVMRHGYRPDPQLDIPAAQTGGTPGNVLGCYYCNDVVAPTDVSVTNIVISHLVVVI